MLENDDVTVIDENGEILPSVNRANVPPSVQKVIRDELYAFYRVALKINPQAAMMFAAFTFNFAMIALNAGLQKSNQLGTEGSAAIGLAVPFITFLGGAGAVPFPFGVGNQIGEHLSKYNTLREEGRNEETDKEMKDEKKHTEAVHSFGIYVNLGIGVVIAGISYVISDLLPFLGQDKIVSDQVGYITRRFAPALFFVTLRAILDQIFFASKKVRGLHG